MIIHSSFEPWLILQRNILKENQLVKTFDFDVCSVETLNALKLIMDNSPNIYEFLLKIWDQIFSGGKSLV